MTSLLDFYQQHGISPVKQDVTDLPAHFARRAFLYRSLGLPPSAICGKAVLEVGPGSGENALYTASLRPRKYVLLEPNPSGSEALQERLCGQKVEVRDESLEAYQPLRPVTFDVVLCEGLLGLAGGNAAGHLLQILAGRLGSGGVLVVTCIDPISDCAEVLRRAHAQKYIAKGQTLHEQVAILRPIFAPHLATLKGMTRSVHDWILDNLLNPASIGPTFSIPQAIEALDAEFDVLGCSPRFLQDWRWYKEGGGNQWAIDSYWSQCHNLLDYRTVSPPRSREWNEALMEACQRMRDDVAKLERGDCAEIEIIRDPMTDPGWFGRGQQYLSFVKR